MHAATSTEISIQCLSWINAQLRQEIQSRRFLETASQVRGGTRLGTRMKSLFLCVMTGIFVGLFE
jgi:hypothetical protein